uniref:Variant surface glycoprotein 1125.404 n=1 Tax=Trypanosoma brucei TaxID=5691 RepID=A0A1J0R5U6_9TRYP|nr:variant surface glycoprotein 1125.404 [Trypanosoma brucei]
MTRQQSGKALALTLLLTAMAARRSSGTQMGVQLSDLKLACALAGDLKATAPNAAFQLNKRADDAEELQQLKEDLTLLAQKPENADYTELKLVAELVRKQVRRTSAMIKEQVTAAIQLVGAAATLAGRIDDLVRLMLIQGQSGTSTCVSSGAGFKGVNSGTTNLPGCTATSTNMATLPDEKLKEQTIDIKGKFEAVPSGGTGITGSGASCLILHHGASSGLGQADAGAMLLGGLLQQSSAVGTAATWKGGSTNLQTTGADYSTVDTKQRQFMAAIRQYDDINKKLLKLIETEETSAEEIVIEAGAIYDKHPKEKKTMSKPKAEAIRKMIENYRKPLQGDKLDKERDAFFLKQLYINITACEMGAKPNPKENCEVTKPQTAKCDGKEQGDCEKATGCEWNKTEGKCKLTKTAQKEAERANQESEAKDGKTVEKCAKHGSAKIACEKDSNCKWENNACKDSSFLIRSWLLWLLHL